MPGYRRSFAWPWKLLKTIKMALEPRIPIPMRVLPFWEDWAQVQTAATWYLPEQARGAVLLVHGFGEHSGRYLDSVIPVLAGQGWAVLTYDLAGHGKSAGRRGVCDGYPQLLDQLSGAWDALGVRFPDAPKVLYGHSLGGNLVLNFVLRGLGKPAGVIGSSPYLRLAFRPPAWKWQLGRLLLHLAPKLTLPSGLDPEGISSDPQEVLAYREDPLIHSKVSPNFSFPVIDAGQWALDHAGQWEAPALILHGTSDPIIDPEGSRAFCAKAQNTDLYLAEGARHELHHDTCRAAVLRKVLEFLNGIG